ncbi:MAG: DNA integrity scanning diadenylate cyclase DisA [Candidatus Pacearchaeota archaeon]
MEKLKDDEKEQELLSMLKLVAPGTALRTAIEDVAKAKLGAMIVIGDTPEVLKLTNGGFEVNCKFSPQKLVELCKMDGAVILDSELKKILFANTLLVPDHTIPTSETGTRHKAAERTAKQTGQLVITVSERKNIITLYKGNIRYVLKSAEDILNRADATLRMLEKEKERFNELIMNLNVLEFTNLTSLNDIVLTIQRAEIASRIEDIIRRYILELGVEGALVKLQLKEMRKGIDNEEFLILKDYSQKDPLATKIALSELTLDQLTEPLNILALLGYQKMEDPVITKGYRILNKSSLSKNEIELIVNEANNLQNIFDMPEKIIELIGENKAAKLMKELMQLKEQALLGKKI